MVAVSCISVQAAAPSLSRYLYFAATQLVLFAYLRSREHEGADRKPQPAHPASRLEEYRRRQAYETLERFHEEGESAKTTDRSHPGVRRTCLAARRRPVQASLEHRQRYQQVFFPDGMSFDGNGCIGNGVTALIFSYLRTIEDRNKRMVDQTGASWNQFQGFIRGIHALRLACGSLADD